MGVRLSEAAESLLVQGGAVGSDLGMPLRIFPTTTALDTSGRPWATANLERMLRAGRAYRGGDFVLADRADAADVVLFVESTDPYMEDILRSELFRRHRSKACVFVSHDNAPATLPGLYACTEAPFRRPELQLASFYIRSFDNEVLRERTGPTESRWLFSFVGRAANAPDLRLRVLRLAHPRALLRDQTSGMRDDDPDYVEFIRSSAFVLCPRGIGPSTWRVYETMMAGRVPVILSDRWTEPRGFSWSEFSIRVPEADLDRIPELCESMKERAAEMGARARKEWERNCSLENAFGWIGSRLIEITRGMNGQPHGTGSEFLRELAFRGECSGWVRWRLGRALRRMR